ncbi:glycosyltransferase [Coraliomargarita parva]|uniref:glycosyltransferase n=1 Tax=Coraliomargarita parva TaxID=3014050 RepID=UPI0022B34A8A|nr:glycosyltransferase [Coraliomargarita parva]
MKLLRIINTIAPESGGPIEGLKRASAIMTGEGVQVEIACGDTVDALHEAVRSLPWPVYRLGPGKLGSYGYSVRMRDWLDRHVCDYDAVIIHGNWQYHGLAASRACVKHKVPYFIYPHGMLDPWFNRNYPLKKIKKQLYWNWGEHQVLQHARAVLFTCEEERRLARESFRPYRVTEKVIGYGTSHPGASVLRATRSDFPWGDSPYLLYLGRIQEKKGIDLLVEAYASWSSSQSAPPHLVIAGPVQQEDFAAEIRSRFPQDRIHWIGSVQGEAKWALLSSAEALTLVSHQENFGLVVAEALAVGTPVLISDKVNIWREIQEGGAGLVEDDSLDGAMALLSKWQVIRGPERQAMRQKAQSVFHDHFDIRQATLRLIRFLDECLNKDTPVT